MLSVPPSGSPQCLGAPRQVAPSRGASQRLVSPPPAWPAYLPMAPGISLPLRPTSSPLRVPRESRASKRSSREPSRVSSSPPARFAPPTCAEAAWPTAAPPPTALGPTPLAPLRAGSWSTIPVPRHWDGGHVATSPRLHDTTSSNSVSWRPISPGVFLLLPLVLPLFRAPLAGLVLWVSSRAPVSPYSLASPARTLRLFSCGSPPTDRCCFSSPIPGPPLFLTPSRAP